MENEITRQPVTDEESGIDDSQENPLEQDSQDDAAEAPEEERSPTPEATGQGAGDEPEATAARPRSLKLVLTLQPEGASGYRAMLAVGAEGCDPVLRSAVVAGIAEALDRVPALVAEAEARWQLQPRYPAVAASKAPAATSSGRPPKASQKPARAEDEAAPKPVPGAAPTDQLPLFG